MITTMKLQCDGCGNIINKQYNNTNLSGLLATLGMQYCEYGQGQHHLVNSVLAGLLGVTLSISEI